MKDAPCWNFIFPLSQFHGEGELKMMREFLETRLTREARFKFMKDHLLITAHTKNDGFRAAGFVNYGNPLGRRLFYSIRGYDETGKLILNTMEKKKLTRAGPLVGTAKLHSDGKITIPKNMRVMLNLVDGDSVTLRLEEDRVTVTPTWREKKSA
jgi:hypothetical protein